MLEINFHPDSRKYILRIEKKLRLKILNKIAELAELNHPLDHIQVIKLSGRRSDDYRLRIGSYRVKFTLRRGMIFVTDIDHRQAGY